MQLFYLYLLYRVGTKIRTRKSTALFNDIRTLNFRLQAVPFWLVKRVRSQHSETGVRRNKQEEAGGEASFSRLSPSPPPLVHSSFFALGYFPRPLDYPERDCVQSI